MWFIQLFRLTFLLEAAPWVDFNFFGGAISAVASASILLFSLFCLHFSSSFFLSSPSSSSLFHIVFFSVLLLLFCLCGWNISCTLHLISLCIGKKKIVKAHSFTELLKMRQKKYSMMATPI